MYEHIKLEEVADVTKLAGFEFSKYIEYQDKGEIIALRALNIKNNKLDLTDVKYIDNKTSEKLTRSKLYKNDILLTYTGNGWGDSVKIIENDKYHLAPNLAKITPKQINPDFLLNYMQSYGFLKQMENYLVGSSQPTIPMKFIRKIEIPHPPKDIQNKIGGILNLISKKIQINNSINNNLTTSFLFFY
ncbi:restriction endonuclease subunit S [Methanosphaera sp. BMS]|uniref:restriction endonuclease subunit S n=1 Tax=Methanosphaera sp. BMS TaxID=1789762 RepID=UPI000DC1EF1E|nr:restriction endonuclease subunit S [Methanosphaera sp. BMS]AWX31795.1 hypothetical protein AW729_01245 [Methanosphaera sp. BMS]